MSPRHPSRPVRTVGAAVACLALLAGCSAARGQPADGAADSADVSATGVSTDSALFDSSVVHHIEVTFDDGDYAEIIDTYATTGEKDWIAATVVIDGATYENVGLRLKGNSSLFGLSTATSGNPEDLPWLIRLDKYVDGQSVEGHTDIVIRSSSTETALNEAVAQELLDLAGLANQDPIATTFTVNDGETELRLAVELPNDDWDDANFGDGGVLYKAESTGDYSYRGDDVEAYTDVFDQEAGEDDLDPLIDFLEFINTADDATFDTEIGDHLDLDAFATYLAFQDLVGNNDDIDGRGNNSYLHYDYDTERFTVVSWDLNLAFGTANVNGGGGGGAAPGAGGPGGGPRPAGQAPAGAAPGGAAPGGAAPGGAAEGAVEPGAGGAGGQSNVLVQRLLANEAFAERYDDATAELQDRLFTSGAADDILTAWTDLLLADASELVDVDTIEAESSTLAAYVANVVGS